MSNALAIATVTATLKEVLQESATYIVNGAEVTTFRPQQMENQNGNNNSARINIYLYQIVPNTALRTADLPTRRNDGTLIQLPQSAWDLHYLFSFYGEESTLEAQRLLGSTVDVLHSQPFLSRNKIRSIINNNANGNNPFLTNSNLHEQVESIKFVPLILNLEELSKVWSVFFQTTYSLSVAYQASVVLIEARDIARPTLPVRDRNIQIIGLRQPLIETIEPQMLTKEQILTIRGQMLQGEVTQVKLDEVTVEETDFISLSNSEIQIALPDGLVAGVNSVQVLHLVDMSSSSQLELSPPELRSGFESNVAAFVLRPAIAEAGDGSNEIQVLANQPDFDQEFPTANPNDPGNRLTVAVEPPVLRVQLNLIARRRQQILLLLNEIVDDTVERLAQFYNFSSPALLLPEGQIPSAVPIEEQQSDTLVFSITGVQSGEYLVRVKIDGAESLLTVDSDRNSSTFNQYVAPTVTIA